MKKYGLIVLVVALVACGGGRSKHKSAESVDEEKNRTEQQSVDKNDAVPFNPFVAFTESQIDGFKADIVKLHEENERQDRFPEEYDVHRKSALNELFDIFDNDNYRSRLGLITWRLDRYRPLGMVGCKSRRKAFESVRKASEELLDYRAETDVDIRNQQFVCSGLEHYRELLVEAVLLNDSRSAAERKAIADENQFIGQCAVAQDTVAKVVVAGKGYYAMWPIAYEGYKAACRNHRIELAEAFACALADSTQAVRYPFAPVSIEQIDKEFDLATACFGEQADPDYDYSPDVYKGAIEVDREAFKAWIGFREQNESVFAGSAGESYRATTQRLKRAKLIELKNRYYGSGASDNDYGQLLSAECSDAELANYRFAF